MAKKFRFQFIHFNEKTDEETVTNYYFDFVNATDEEIQVKYDKSMQGSAYEDFLYEMEEFGTHDFSAGGDELHGFESSEINPARYNTVIKRWRRYFTFQVGLEIGPTYITEGYEDQEGITL